MTVPQGAQYSIDKAKQCFRLANGCSDAATAFKLRELAFEFVGKAIDLGADPRFVPRDGYDASVRE